MKNLSLFSKASSHPDYVIIPGHVKARSWTSETYFIHFNYYIPVTQ